ncbi:TonB-dependent receptor [hydrothermal vent metagenome]|uniref:TonB-dependent receptor n=1 Tax=hydrothermal vent metagenome TaxID=652676 RepID=A0A3B0T5Q8_9ZZZZ
MFGKKQLLSSAAIAVAFTTPGSFAYGEEADDKGAGLEEVVVTSRKTEENILDVPLAITVFNAATIESAGIDNMSDVASLTPGLNFYNPIGESLATPIIRGVAQTDIFGENNTAVFVDGVYVSSRSGINMSQLDIARIEVIKGPQSAMYGRNAFSGAINIVTAEPGDEVSGKIVGTVGNEGKFAAQASISGPIVEDKMSGRLSLSYDTWNGSYDNAVENGPDIGGYEFKTINGSLYITPNENFTALFTGYYSDDQLDDSPMSAVPANCEDQDAFTGDGLRYQNFCGVLPSIEKGDLFISKGATGTKREILRLSAKLEWESEIGTFESLTGYGRLKSQVKNDYARGNDGFDMVYLTSDGFLSPSPGTAGYFTPSLMRFDSFKVDFVDHGSRSVERDFSQEFRYSSPTDRSVRGSIGVFYYNARRAFDDGGAFMTNAVLPDDFTTYGPIFTFPAGPTVGVIPLGNYIFSSFYDFGAIPEEGVFSDDDFSKEESISGFGYVEADLADGLVGRVEVRYTSDKKSFRRPGESVGEVGVNCVFANGISNCNDKWTNWTTRFSFEYHPTDDWLLFATVAKGAKSGGFDGFSLGGGISGVSSFDPESNWTYEIGAKGRMMDGRLIGELSVYYIDWDNIVVPQVVDAVIPGGGAALPVSVNANAGTAKVTGAELSVQAMLSEGFTINFGASYTNSRFIDAQVESFEEFPSFAPNGDISGNKLLRQPKWQFNISPIYETQINEDIGMFIRADIMHEGKSFVGNTNQAIIPGRTKVNARGGVRMSGGLEVELWVENLFNDNKAEAAFRDVYLNNTVDGMTSGDNTLFPWRMSVIHPRLRTFGITARYKF